MRRTVWRRLSVGLVLVLTLSVLAAARPPGFQREPGEAALSEAEQAEVLEGADGHERQRLGAIFADEAGYLPVAYTRAWFRVVPDRDGSITVTEVGRADARPDSHLRLSDPPTAAAGVPGFEARGSGADARGSGAPTAARATGASGAAGRYDLYASIGIARLSGPGYRWVVASYFRWNGSSGIDACNRNEDSIATAWAGGLALYDDAGHGFYRPYGSTVTPLDIYRSDATPNVGVGWSFHELKQRSSQICTIVNWGEGDAYITEPSWQSRTSNVIMKYVHTKGSTSYSLGFSVPSGFGPSISISPADGNHWSAAAFATFNH